MDLVRYACYPFLPGVRDAVQEVGPDVTDLLSSSMYEGVRRAATTKVMAAITGEEATATIPLDDRQAVNALLTHGVARMLLVCLGDRMLNRRYARQEASRMGRILARDEEGLEAVRAALGVAATTTPEGHRIHFTDYLRVAPVERGWGLVEQRLDAGHLDLGRRRFLGLLEHAYRARFEAEVEEELKRGAPSDLVGALTPYLETLQPVLESAREEWNTGDFGPVRSELFPPCIVDLFGRMVQGEMLPHHGRFAVASFLATVGMDSNAIMDYFRAIPNFDPEKSKYQITHIAGEQAVEKYTPPGCQWMQTNGVCPLDKRDNLCARIKHPLSYYRAQINRQKKAEAAAAQKQASAGTDKGGGAAAG